MRGWHFLLGIFREDDKSLLLASRLMENITVNILKDSLQMIFVISQDEESHFYPMIVVIVLPRRKNHI